MGGRTTLSPLGFSITDFDLFTQCEVKVPRSRTVLHPFQVLFTLASMSEEDFSAVIATWLSEVASNFSPQCTPTHSLSHSNSTSIRKRKRSLSIDDLSTESNSSHTHKRAALTKLNLKSLPTVKDITVGEDQLQSIGLVKSYQGLVAKQTLVRDGRTKHA